MIITAAIRVSHRFNLGGVPTFEFHRWPECLTWYYLRKIPGTASTGVTGVYLPA